MNFLFDIDQTLSTGHVGKSLIDSIAYYRELGIYVPDGIVTYPQLFQLPDVLCRHELIPGASSAVNMLSEFGTVKYCTVRDTKSEGITRGWLRQHHFPAPDRLTMCGNLMEKLTEVACKLAGDIVFFDDRALEIVGRWSVLVEHAPEVASSLSRRLILVAFGHTDNQLQEYSPVPIVALPGWSSIHTIVQLLEKRTDVSL